MTALSGRALNVALAVDELANALLGGRPQETISGTIGRACLQFAPPWWANIARSLVDSLFGSGHCIGVAQKELTRRSAS